MVILNLPWQVWAGIAVTAAFFGWGEIRHCSGKAEVQAEWDKAKANATAIVTNVQEKSDDVTVQTEIRYVDRIQVVKEKGDVIVREVPVYVPADSCDLPGGFRLLHDAAAINSIPEASELPYAAPVPAQDAARTVAENYKSCNEVRINLEELQGWVQQQRELYLDQCKQQPLNVLTRFSSCLGPLQSF